LSKSTKYNKEKFVRNKIDSDCYLAPCTDVRTPSSETAVPDRRPEKERVLLEKNHK